MADIYLKQIFTYPLKSAAGIAFKNSAVSDRGLQYDRWWMLIDKHNRFLSARKFHRMVLIRCQISKNLLVLSAPGMNELRIPLAGSSGPKIAVQIWKDECMASSCGEEAQDWFSNFLGTSARMVFMPPESRRLLDARYTDGQKRVGFADGYPFLLISEASLSDLNTRLNRPLEMARFRPNLIVGGARPYEEDEWKSVRIGEIIFQLVKPCSRCVITTIDPNTAQVGKEPLRTLARYRSRGGKVLFGQNLVHLAEGGLSVGMPVEILDR